MRGGKDATANIATGIATAVEVAAGKDIGSIVGESEMTRASRPHAVTAGITGAGAAVGTMTIADDTGTTGPCGAGVAAGNIAGRREMDVVKGLQRDGGVIALNVGEVIDKHFKNRTPRQLQEPSCAGVERAV